MCIRDRDDGNEMFGSSAIARSLVRSMTTLGNNISKIIPEKVKVWLDSRFNKDEAILANGAAFDLVRASVNLVLAGLLIALGTSLKLPLSTTYVAFMVEMCIRDRHDTSGQEQGDRQSITARM